MSEKPKTCKRLMVHKLTVDFRAAVSVDETDMCHPAEGEVCVRNKYVGINATDVNMSKGRYGTVGGKIPFAVGMEGLGTIVEVGSGVTDFKVGQSVGYMSSRLNAYAEYVCSPIDEVYSIPEEKPEYLPLLVSGSTASIGLDKAARIMPGEKVLVTAAAGGVGHIAVQWAKAAGCHVIGTCSTKAKEAILKSFGCDRVINYREESLADVLADEYKDGIDVAWETIGGAVFESCIKNLAVKGRLIIIGGISSYKSEDRKNMDISFVPSLLQVKSASLVGFKRGAYKDDFAQYFYENCKRLQEGKLKVILDNGENSTGSEFLGMEGIIKGVEYLHSGKSTGKVIARIY